MSVGLLMKRIFTWWNGQTIGTWLDTKRHGYLIGQDSQGNSYYKSSNDVKTQRRWVIYNGTIEASRIPPEWHLWIHRITDTPPTEMDMLEKSFEKPHQENLTASPLGYAPVNSLVHKDIKKSVPDYTAWSPETHK